MTDATTPNCDCDFVLLLPEDAMDIMDLLNGMVDSNRAAVQQDEASAEPDYLINAQMRVFNGQLIELVDDIRDQLVELGYL